MNVTRVHCLWDLPRRGLVHPGLLVGQDALVEALQTGVIKAAVLDVTYPEPLPR